MPKADINKEVIKSNEIYGKTSKATGSSNDSLTIEEVIKKLPPGFSAVYRDRGEIQNYNQPGSLFHGLSEKAILDKISEKAIGIGLDIKHVKAFRRGSDIYEKWMEQKENHNTDKVNKDTAEKVTNAPPAKIVQFINPLLEDHLESLKSSKFVYKTMSMNEKWARLVVADPNNNSIYFQNLKITSDDRGETESLNVINEDIIIDAFFENVIIHEQRIPGISDLPRKIEFNATSGALKLPIHIGPCSDKDAISKLEQHGLVLNSNRSMDCFRSIILGFIEQGKVDRNQDAGLPGFYLDPSTGKIIVSGYLAREIRKLELRTALEALNTAEEKFPQARFGTFIKWCLVAPFFYILKQMGIYPRHFLMIGPTGTQKTALAKLSHAIWGFFDIPSQDRGLFISGTMVDSQYRLGKNMGMGTFPVVVDEPKGLFEKPALVEMLKTATQNLIARETADGVYPALSPVVITTNVSIENNEDILAGRFDIIRSTQREQIHATVKQKEEFQKFEASTYPLLEPIGQYVASKILSNPELLTAEYEALGETLLEKMYADASLETPDFVYLRAEIDTLENLNESTIEMIRTYLNRRNLEVYSSNIGKSAIIRTSSNGTEFLEYDDRSTISAAKKIETSIRMGLISWEIYKNTGGVEQVILTTAFAKEISRMVGESYNLQSIGELLGFEVKNVRLGNTTPRALVVNLPIYLEFLNPDIDISGTGDLERKTRDTLRTLKANNPQVNEASTTEESKEKIEKPWKTPDESNASVTSEASKDKTDTGPHEDPPKTEKAENAMDPVLKHLRDRTSERSNKFMTVYELYHALPLGCDWSESYIYGRLEEQVRLGKVVRDGIKYAIKEFLDGSSETRSEHTVSGAPTGNPRYYTYRALKSFELNGRTYRAGIDFILTDYLKDLVDSGHLKVVT